MSLLKVKLAVALTVAAASLSVMAGPQVAINTSEGRIVVDLNEKAAPITVANFLNYVKKGYYKDTIFHRVIPNFMIQGGGYTRGMTEKPGAAAPIKLEDKNGLKNTVGTIAMARTNNPNSATSQFFINLKDNDFLDGTSTKDGYAVFGKVIQGMDVVRKIARAPTTDKGFHENVPVRAITIRSVEIIK